MLVFTVRNAVLLALMQVTIIVFGVLFAGAAGKTLGALDLPPMGASTWFANYGVFLLTLPLVWTYAVLKLRTSSTVSDNLKAIVFVSGFACIGLLLIPIYYAAVKPFAIIVCG